MLSYLDNLEVYFNRFIRGNITPRYISYRVKSKCILENLETFIYYLLPFGFILSFLQTS